MKGESVTGLKKSSPAVWGKKIPLPDKKPFLLTCSSLGQARDKPHFDTIPKNKLDFRFYSSSVVAYFRLTVRGSQQKQWRAKTASESTRESGDKGGTD